MQRFKAKTAFDDIQPGSLGQNDWPHWTQADGRILHSGELGPLTGIRAVLQFPTLNRPRRA